MSQRIFFYSHDTVGLGHIRRTQKIANRLAGNNRSILIACASPVASTFLSEEGIEYLNLPGFTKLMTGEYIPRNLHVPISEFVDLRSSILLSAVMNFKPDVIIVDKEPLGVKQELRPALQYVREVMPETHIICGFRDILDDDKTISKEWERRDTAAALEELYDSIFVYGRKEIYDYSKEYSCVTDKIASKIHYTGYVNPDSNREPGANPAQFFPTKKPIVTVTMGGGGDGEDVIEHVLNLIQAKLCNSNFNLLLLTGPFIRPEIMEKVKSVESQFESFRSVRFVNNTEKIFKESDLIVTMGGYNTMCELVALGKYPLVIPRVVPRVEQLIRAKVFKERGLCDFIDPRELTAPLLAIKIEEMLESCPKPKAGFDISGLEKIEKYIEGALQ